MSEKKITIKDISLSSGYSLASVHRALNNKDGISAEVRNKILNIASSLGYEVNYLASSLKKSPVKIALIMPEPDSYGNYYKYILQGCRDMLSDMSAFNCELITYFSDISKDIERKQLDILNNIYKSKDNFPNGIVIVPVKNTIALEYSLKRFINKNIPVLLIDNEFKNLNRLCCISPQDTTIGRLGAEFMCGMQPHPGYILVASGDNESLSHVYNLKGFKEYLKENNLPYEIIEVGDNNSIENFSKNVINILQNKKYIVGLYSVRARNTIPLCNAARITKMLGKLKIVGSDLFPESANALENKILNGIIYKNPYQKGFRGMKILFDFLVKNEKPKFPFESVQSFVILRSNLKLFKEYLQ